MEHTMDHPGNKPLAQCYYANKVNRWWKNVGHRTVQTLIFSKLIRIKLTGGGAVVVITENLLTSIHTILYGQVRGTWYT